MRLRQLECFVRTCELGSITRAAEQLNIAQPALGLQIRNLEHDFGVELLVRTSRGVSPTPAGALMLAWARDVIRRTREVKTQLRTLAGADVDALRLGLSPSVTSLLAGTILEEAGREIPGLSLRLVEALSHVIAKQVEDEQIDLALITGPFERRALDQRPMLREGLYLVGPARGSAGPITLADALALPLAMPGENDALRGIVETAAQQIDLPVTTAYEIASIAAIKDLVARGMAHAILPYGAIRREMLSHELTARQIVAPTLSRTLYLVRGQGRSVGARERRLVEVIRNCLAGLTKNQVTDTAFELL